MAAIIDMTPDEMASLIEENVALKAALQKATAAFLYLSGARDESMPDWDTLPEESYQVEGGIRSGRATYMEQAADASWLEYWGEA